MIYYATREVESYLERISKISTEKEPHCLVSVIGGLSFFHAIGPATTELILFDRNKDAIKYCKTIISMIGASKSIEEFISMLFGCTVNEKWEFKSLVNRNHFSLLLGRGTFEAYKSIFGEFTTDLQQRVSRFGKRVVVNFCGNSHESMNFNWLFGRFAFQNNDSFLQLKNKLLTIPITYKCCLAEDLNPKEIIIEDKHYYLLMSNCEGFSQELFNEPIYERIVDNNKIPFTYIGWGKCILNNANKNHKDAVEKISRMTQGRDVLECKSFFGNSFSKAELSAKSHAVVSLEGLSNKVRRLAYGDTFLYHISINPDLPIKKREEQIIGVLKAVKDKYRRIIILEWQRSLSTDHLMKIFMNCKMHYYYTVQVDWSGDNGYSRSTLMVWNRR